jgi:hypothetical protein
MRGGVLQAQLYEQAGQTAYQQGVFGAASKLGMAAFQAGQSSSPIFDRTSYNRIFPAPVETRAVG